MFATHDVDCALHRRRSNPWPRRALDRCTTTPPTRDWQSCCCCCCCCNDDDRRRRPYAALVVPRLSPLFPGTATPSTRQLRLDRGRVVVAPPRAVAQDVPDFGNALRSETGRAFFLFSSCFRRYLRGKKTGWRDREERLNTPFCPIVFPFRQSNPASQIDLRSVYAHADELLGNATQLSEQARTACAELVSYAQTRFAYV